MAARSKRTRSTGPVAHDSLGLHARASQHREDLLDEARELRTAGRIREARALESRAGQVDQLVGALATETGLSIPE